MRGVPLEASRVSLKNCRLIRATSIPSKGSLIFAVSILTGTGDFEVAEGNSTVATGTIGFLLDHEDKIRSLKSPDLVGSQDLWMNKKDLYKELRLRGYQYRYSRLIFLSRSSKGYLPDKILLAFL